MKVTLIQSDLVWENADANLERFAQKIGSIDFQTDLIVLPEMFGTAFSMKSKALAETMDGKTVNWLKYWAKRKNCVIVGSVIICEQGDYYNRLIWMRPDASFEFYDKKHLFRMANENNYYSAGNQQLITTLDEWRFRPLICYDLRFPVWSRNRGDYDVLIYVANWPERRSDAWKTLLRARAIENQCYVIGVNRVGTDGNNVYFSGDSAVISHKGQVLTNISAGAETSETVNLSLEELNTFRKEFPAALDADNFEIIT